MRGKAKATLVLEEAILEIVEERKPLTVRGVAYALFVRNLIPSMAVGQTQRVSRITVEMRERGTLPWEWIVDDSRRVRSAATWDDPNLIIEAAVSGYRRNNWQEQPTIVEVWTEKSTVEGVLAPVLDDLGVNFQVMKGFGSLTAVKRAAVELEPHRQPESEGRRPLRRRLGPQRHLHERERPSGTALALWRRLATQSASPS